MAGRPEFKVTAALRQKVSIAAGAGWSHEEIAIAVGVCRNTLEKHFEKELSVGAYERKLETLSALHKAAKKGNVAAIKAYNSMVPRAAAPPGDEFGKPLGKKEQQAAAAVTAQQGTEWEDILPRAQSTSLQ